MGDRRIYETLYPGNFGLSRALGPFVLAGLARTKRAANAQRRQAE
jgi:hypothetical protein